MLYPVDHQGGTAGGSQAQGVLTLRDYGEQGRLADIYDPRLAGSYRMILDQDFQAAERGSSVWMASGRIDSAEGSWLEHFTGSRHPGDLWYHQGAMSGTGAYEGLPALVLFEDTGPSYRVHGMVFPGDLPEARPIRKSPSNPIAPPGLGSSGHRANSCTRRGLVGAAYRSRFSTLVTLSRQSHLPRS
jgi:hypothetical protein